MLAALIALAVASTTSPTLKGTWELEAGRSAHDRVIGETVIIGGDDKHEVYSATVRLNGQAFGSRFEATIDGPDAPLLSLDGKVVGRARVKRLGPNNTLTEMMPDQGVARMIDHRLSIDGNTMISLLLDPAGKVLSVLVFKRI